MIFGKNLASERKKEISDTIYGQNSRNLSLAAATGTKTKDFNGYTDEYDEKKILTLQMKSLD